jgi:hypothetical protein
MYNRSYYASTSFMGFISGSCEDKNTFRNHDSYVEALEPAFTPYPIGRKDQTNPVVFHIHFKGSHGCYQMDQKRGAFNNESEFIMYPG